MQDLDKEIDLKKFITEDMIKTYGLCDNMDMSFTKEQILEKLKEIDTRNKNYLLEQLQNNPPKLKTDEELNKSYIDYKNTLNNNIKVYTNIVYNLNKSIKTLEVALKNIPKNTLTNDVVNDALNKLKERKNNTQSSLDDLKQQQKEFPTLEQYKEDKLLQYKRTMKYYNKIKKQIKQQLNNFKPLANQYEEFIKTIDKYLK